MMKYLGRRAAMSLGTILFVGAFGLSALEWQRRSRVAASDELLVGFPSQELTPAGDASDVQADYGDPDHFAKLCANIREKYIAMDDRYRALEHNEERVDRVWDGNGAVKANTRTLERVWFVGDIEHRETIERENLLGGEIDRAVVEVAKAPKQSFFYPFSREETPTDYAYAWVGVEERGGKPTLRVRFEARPPFERKLTGWVWVDPATFEPIAFEGRVVKPWTFVDRFDMLTEYGLSTDGEMQVRRLLSRGVGGFAIVQRTYEADIRYGAYRSRGQ